MFDQNSQAMNYSMAPYDESRISGPLSLGFIEALKSARIDFSGSLSLLVDRSGRAAGLKMQMSNPPNDQDNVLTVTLLENPPEIDVTYRGQTIHQSKAKDAVGCIVDVMADRLVVLERYELKRHEDSSIMTIEEARRILDANRYRSRGCLDFLLPRRHTSLWIKSWSGRANDHNNNQ